jgi:hypothetical protein
MNNIKEVLGLAVILSLGMIVLSDMSQTQVTMQCEQIESYYSKIEPLKPVNTGWLFGLFDFVANIGMPIYEWVAGFTVMMSDPCVQKHTWFIYALMIPMVALIMLAIINAINPIKG